MAYTSVVVIPAYNEEKTIKNTLEALVHQTVPFRAIIVVNNTSTDATVHIVQEMQGLYPDVALYLLHEPEKGTGAACNTGFSFAINSLYADIVLRTDADTVPVPTWHEAVQSSLRDHPDYMLLSGPTMPLRDEYYKGIDSIWWPFMWRVHKFTSVLITRSLFMARAAIGHNMAVLTIAYTAAGGFANTSIAEQDEDLDLSRRICAIYGLKAMGYCSGMKVSTSMRRVRTIGYRRLMRYYWNPGGKTSAEYRVQANGGDVDVR